MSLFEWSTPEPVDQTLPIIPNEIYLLILELIAPSARPLDQQKLKILSNLSRTCRFFANLCLPRIFELVALSSSSVRYYFSPRHAESALGSILCTQIAAKQPLVLALAKSVKECLVYDAASRGDEGLVRKYLAVSNMKNVCKLHFQDCKVDGEWWSMLVTLPWLDDLAFDSCKFPQHPTYTELDENLKLKVSQLRVVDCGTTGYRQTIEAIDREFLRALAMDWTIEEEDWLRQSAITKLQLYAVEDVEDSDAEDDSEYSAPDPRFTPELNVAPMKVPRSVEALAFTVNSTAGYIIEDVAESMVNDPAWKDLSSLCSFTFDVEGGTPDTDEFLREGTMDMDLLMLLYVR